MQIVWDLKKNANLKKQRNVCFEDVYEKLINNEIIDTLENPVREGQIYFIVRINNYIHVVPAVINGREQLVLKTIFPSRKFNKIYGGDKNEKK